MQSDYQFDISMRPDYSLLTVNLQSGQKIYAEPGSMASMSTGIELKAGLKGGLFKSLGRAFGGESLVINTYTAQAAGEVTFAPGPMGDLEHYRVESSSLILQKGAFVAHGDWSGS